MDDAQMREALRLAQTEADILRTRNGKAEAEIVKLRAEIARLHAMLERADPTWPKM